MRNTIMTEKIARRGVRVPAEYHADFLDQILVRDVCSKGAVTLLANQTVGDVRLWINSHAPGTQHQGFPILDEHTRLLIGVLTRRNLLNPEVRGDKQLRELITRRTSIVYDDCTLRDAADHMVNHDIGRLPVVQRDKPGVVIGMITRSDLLGAHRRRLLSERESEASFGSIAGAATAS